MTDDDPCIQILRDLLCQAIAREESAELTLPHIVLCADPGSGVTTYCGPYPDALTALASIRPDGDFRYSVAALYPPTALG